jgi:hypothetical protein
MRKWTTQESDAKQLLKARRLATRKRAVAACQSCRDKKIKCSDYRPCANCNAAPNSVCTIANSKGSTVKYSLSLSNGLSNSQAMYAPQVWQECFTAHDDQFTGSSQQQYINNHWTQISPTHDIADSFGSNSQPIADYTFTAPKITNQTSVALIGTCTDMKPMTYQQHVYSSRNDAPTDLDRFEAMGVIPQQQHLISIEPESVPAHWTMSFNPQEHLGGLHEMNGGATDPAMRDFQAWGGRMAQAVYTSELALGSSGVLPRIPTPQVKPLHLFIRRSAPGGAPKQCSYSRACLARGRSLRGNGGIHVCTSP